MSFKLVALFTIQLLMIIWTAGVSSQSTVSVVQVANSTFEDNIRVLENNVTVYDDWTVQYRVKDGYLDLFYNSTVWKDTIDPLIGTSMPNITVTGRFEIDPDTLEIKNYTTPVYKGRRPKPRIIGRKRLFVGHRIEKRGLKDWQTCSKNEECSNNCCSSEHSSPDYKCVPWGQTRNRCTGRLETEIFFSKARTNIEECVGIDVLWGMWNACGGIGGCFDTTSKKQCSLYSAYEKTSFDVTVHYKKATWMSYNWDHRNFLTQMVIDSYYKLSIADSEERTGCEKTDWNSRTPTCLARKNYWRHYVPRKMWLRTKDPQNRPVNEIDIEVTSPQSGYNGVCNSFANLASFLFSIFSGPAGGFFGLVGNGFCMATQ